MLITLPPVDSCDRQFISELYEQYGQFMYSKAMVYLTDQQDADDLIQDCLEHLIRNVSTLRMLGGASLTHYLSITVRNAALNLEKRKEALSYHSYLTDFEDDDPANSAALPEELLLDKEFSERFMRVFGTLPEEDRILLLGKSVQGLEDRELATILGCAPSSIRMKLTRARRKATVRLLEGGLFNDQA